MQRKAEVLFVIATLFLFSLLFPVLADMHQLDSSFCDYTAPEYSEWNVSELIPNKTLSEEWSALNYASNWTTSDALSSYWVGNNTLIHINANATTGFSAAFVNQSKYNRSQSLVWTKVTNVSENSDYVFTGVVYAFYNYTNFSMILFGDNETFLLDYIDTGQGYLQNTLDHSYGDHGGQVIISTDAINYWTEDGVEVVAPYGAWIKTIYNTYCGDLKSKYWSGYPTLMQEPAGWNIEQKSDNMSTDDSVCFGVAFWNPIDYACSNYSVHYDYINNWRLNYTLNHSATITVDGVDHPRPHMDFPIIDMNNQGDDWWDLLMPFGFGGISANITNSTVSSMACNVTNNLSMVSRPFYTDPGHGTVTNDTIYYYTATLTNFTDWYIAYLDAHPDVWGMDPDYFSNNYLMVYVQNCEDLYAGTDEIVIGIDVDNNGQWDDNDRLIINDDGWFGWGGRTWTGSYLDGMDTFYSNVFTYCWTTEPDTSHNIHRYNSHVDYLTLIPLWSLVKSDGEYLNNSDIFGLHVSTFNCNHYGYGMCIWENWNETNCSTFFSESASDDNELRYYNSSSRLTADCWTAIENCWYDCDMYCYEACGGYGSKIGGGSDDCYGDCLDNCYTNCLSCEECMIDIPDSNISLWGEGEIPGTPPVNSSSGHFDINVTVDTNISFVSNNDTTGGVDINISTNITNNGDERVDDIQINITWMSCGCSNWTFLLIDTNIPLTNITWHNDSCYAIITIGNLSSDEVSSLWMTINITECSPIVNGALPVCANVTSDSGLGLNDIECAVITWGTSQHPPVFSNEYPSNGSSTVSPILSNWIITIEDPEGDLFNWTIETSPNIGSSSGNDESDGVKLCPVGGMTRGTRYTVFVNATDPIGSGDSTNETYWFIVSRPTSPGDGSGTEGGDYDVGVSVGDEGDRPIGGAYVEIYEDGVLIDEGYTDESGMYETSLDEGTYVIVVTYGGYEESSRACVINSSGIIFFQLVAICPFCPAIFVGPYFNLSILGWVVTALLIIIGFALTYLFYHKKIEKKYYILIPNGILVILGLLCQPILIIIGIVCCVIQYTIEDQLK